MEIINEHHILLLMVSVSVPSADMSFLAVGEQDVLYTYAALVLMENANSYSSSVFHQKSSNMFYFIYNEENDHFLYFKASEYRKFKKCWSDGIAMMVQKICEARIFVGDIVY